MGFTLVADIHTDNRRIFAAVLAAGSSTRFGSTKQLAKFQGESLVHRSAGVARDICGDRTLLIAGTQWQAVTQSAAEQCLFFALNEHPTNGIGSSIALAAKMLGSRAEALLVLLADQVLITSDHLTNMIDAWSGRHETIVATAFANTTGPPTLFPRATFDDLAKLTGDKGAQALFSDARFRTVCVPLADAAIDIDTRDDLEKMT
jgi:molybdenum cofactor cytidylyltransferase